MTIYKVTSQTSNKSYIGKTKQELSRRLEQHQGNAEQKNQSGHFYSAIRKYGWDDFTCEILEFLDTEEDLNQREVYWIDYYDTFHGDGYNMTPGGEGGSFFGELNGMYGKTHTPEALETMRQTTQAKWDNGDYDDRDITGDNNGFYGKHHTTKTKKAIGVSRKGKTYTEIYGPEEAARKKKAISEAGKGKIPWNKGKRWSTTEADRTEECIGCGRFFTKYGVSQHRKACMV